MNRLSITAPRMSHRFLRTFPFLTLLLLSAAACRTSIDEPLYHSEIKGAGENLYVVSIDSEAGISEDSMRRALLTEAARGAIDHGGIYLRVDDLSMDEKNKTETRRTATTAIAPPASPVGGDVSTANQPNPQPNPATESAFDTVTTYTQHRTGRVRFTIFHDPPPPAAGIYDASKLLDALKHGQIPPMT